LPHEAKHVQAILPLIEHNWLEWSCDKYSTERHNMLRLLLWFSLFLTQCRQYTTENSPALKWWQHLPMHVRMSRCRR